MGILGITYVHILSKNGPANAHPARFVDVIFSLAKVLMFY